MTDCLCLVLRLGLGSLLRGASASRQTVTATYEGNIHPMAAQGKADFAAGGAALHTEYDKV